MYGRFYGLDLKKKGNGHIGKLAIDTLDLSMMKKMAADLKAKGKQLGWLIGVRERILEFFSD